MKRQKILVLAITCLLVPLTAWAFSQADLERLVSGDHNMQNADLSGVTMSNLSPLDGNLGNIDFTNANFSGCNFRGSFENSNLQGARFHNAFLQNIIFSDANLTGASFIRADMSSCSASAAILSNADLSNANLVGANIPASDFSGANLHQANLTDARLSHSDLTGANLTETILTNADLKLVKIDKRWRDYVLSQGVRNPDTIQWIEPAPGVPVNPKDLKSPGAMKFDKKAKVPVGIPKPQ